MDSLCSFAVRKCLASYGSKQIFKQFASNSTLHHQKLKSILNSVLLSRHLATPTPPVPGGKKVFQREKPHCNIGTIGHVDHGKTTLTAAITKVLASKKLAKLKRYEDIDNAPQEKARGITINFMNVEYSTPNRHYNHVDCPGHADYIKNMMAGASLMDGAILVVAATDGAMPQTKEHLILIHQIGVKNIVVFINKVDTADKEMVELVEIELKELLDEIGFESEKIPFVYGSALCALEDKNPEIGQDAVLQLLEKVDESIPIPVRALDKPFLFPIKGVHSIPGRGTVAVGNIERGTIKKGQECEIIGYDTQLKTTVTGIEMFHKMLDEGQAGDQVGLLLRGIKRDEIRRGMVLCKPGTAKTCDHCDVQVYLLTKEEGGSDKAVGNFTSLHMFSKTWVCSTRIFLKDRDMIMPGENASMEIRMNKNMVVEEGQRFTLRSGSTTVGTGVISKILPNLTPDDKAEVEKIRKKLAKEKRQEMKNMQRM